MKEDVRATDRSRLYTPAAILNGGGTVNDSS